MERYNSVRSDGYLTAHVHVSVLSCLYLHDGVFSIRTDAVSKRTTNFTEVLATI